MAANSLEVQDLTTGEDLNKELKEDSFPVVFQCNGCNSVIGDSVSWISSEPELEIIGLNAVTSCVALADILETSTQGADIGSTFTPLQCKTCKSPLGRIYRTTPIQLDQIRNAYCLDAEHIKSYQVGASSGMQKAPAVTSDALHDILTMKALQQAIHKVESVIMMVIERIASLEARCVTSNNQGDHDNKTFSDLASKKVICPTPIDDSKKTKKKRK